MDEIIESVKNQYANMAARTREEAEQWNQKKVKKKKITPKNKDLFGLFKKTFKLQNASMHSQHYLHFEPHRWMLWSSMQDSVSRKFVI